MDDHRIRVWVALGIFGGAGLAIVGAFLPWFTVTVRLPPFMSASGTTSRAGVDTGVGQLVVIVAFALGLFGWLLVAQDRARSWVIATSVAMTALGLASVLNDFADSRAASFFSSSSEAHRIGPTLVVAGGLLAFVAGRLCGSRRPLNPPDRQASEAQVEPVPAEPVLTGGVAVAAPVRGRLVRVADGDRRRAGIPRRFVATMLDGLLFFALALPFLLVDGIQIEQARFGLSNWSWYGGIVVVILYDVVLVAVWGATVGMRVAGIELVDVGTGAMPSWRSATIRVAVTELGRLPYVGPVIGFVVYVPILWRADQRGWHDRLAGTVAVRKE